MKLPLGRGAYKRSQGRLPEVRMVNRYFEADPTNDYDSAALISRPGTSILTGFGSGPIRRLFSLEGLFGGALFVISGINVFQYTKARVKTTLVGVVAEEGTPEMAGTRDYLFITDGVTLQYYNGVGNFATGTLTFSGQPANGETVTIGSTTYTFNTVIGGANSVLIGASTDASIDNLALALAAATGTGAGSLFGSGTVPNLEARGARTATGVFTATAQAPGTAGNAVTTTETIANASWGAATLSGGTANALNGIPTPDDIGIKSMAVIGGFVLLAAAGSDRVYFIRPPNTPGQLPVIDPLDYFTAESLPDAIQTVRVFGDEIWLMGVDSTEVWYLSGVGTIPFDRIRGRAFSRGALEGTAVQIGDAVFLVGDDYRVYEASAGLQPISTHAIEEQIRKAREIERANA